MRVRVSVECGLVESSSVLVARHVFYWVGCVEEAGVKIISRGMQVRRGSWTFFFSSSRRDARACDRGWARAATRIRVAVGEPRFVTSSRTGFRLWAELWLRRNYSAFSKVIRVAPPPPGESCFASVSCARTRGPRALRPSPKFDPRTERPRVLRLRDNTWDVHTSMILSYAHRIYR